MEIKTYQPYIDSRYFIIKNNLKFYRARKYAPLKWRWDSEIADYYRKVWLKKLRSHLILRKILKS